MFDTAEKNPIAMNIRYLFFACVITTLASCTQSKYATQGAYESDDAYVSDNDTYISDFALVDDEAQLAANDSTPATSDDYYDPNYTAPPVYTPNGYNSYNSYGANPWGCNSGYGSGFGSYNYGSYWNPYSPMVGIGWSPYSGYYTQYGMGFGYNPYCSNFYSPYNSWYTPYYSPYYYNSPAYNPWYSPYNYYNSGWGGYYGGTSDQPSNIVYGPRNPISSLGANNSSYTGNVFYSGIKKDDVHTYVNSLNEASKETIGNQPSGVTAPATPSVTKLPSTTHKPTVIRQPSRSYTPSAPSRNEEPRAKPGFHTTPARATTPSKPGRTGTDKKPDTGRKAPSRSSSFDRDEPTERPRYEAPRSTGRESSPPRSSSPSSSPSPNRSSGGGGSTNSPRRK
ncbi:MAG: hypothetical protein ACK478_11440 [Flavobacteriales bacterium]|jgi:hypothetical protein